MTKDEFVAWKSSDSTQAVFRAIQALIQEAKDELATNAGENPIYDRKVVGKINGLETVLNLQFDESEGVTE